MDQSQRIVPVAARQTLAPDIPAQAVLHQAASDQVAPCPAAPVRVDLVRVDPAHKDQGRAACGLAVREDVVQDADQDADQGMVPAAALRASVQGCRGHNRARLLDCRPAALAVAVVAAAWNEQQRQASLAEQPQVVWRLWLVRLQHDRRQQER